MAAVDDGHFDAVRGKDVDRMTFGRGDEMAPMPARLTQRARPRQAMPSP